MTALTARASSVSPSSYTKTIFNNSARVLSWDCFLKLFLAAFVLCIGFVIIKLKIEGQTIYRKPDATKLQNSNQNSTLSWVSLIGLQELRF